MATGIRTYTIELRVEFIEEEKYDVMLEAVRNAARVMLSSAMMLTDKRDPMIALQTGDMFEGNRELDIMGEPGK